MCVNGAPFCKRDRTKSTMCDVMLGHERHVTNIHFALSEVPLALLLSLRYWEEEEEDNDHTSR